MGDNSADKDWNFSGFSDYLAFAERVEKMTTRPETDMDMKPSRRRAADWLTRAGLRPTRQRLTLAELLVGDGRDRHVTAESLHEASRDLDDPVSLATVYNTLKTFCAAGLIAEVTVDGTRSYFDTRIDDHPHYYWEEDGRLTDAPNDAVRLAGEPLVPEGAEVTRIDMVIRLRRRGG